MGPIIPLMPDFRLCNESPKPPAETGNLCFGISFSTNHNMTTLSRRIHQHWSFLGLFYRVLDGLCVIGGLAFSAWWSGVALPSLYLPGAVTLLVYWMLAEVGGMYRSWRGVSSDREVLGMLCTWLVSLAA